jgi:hypothetical protein
MKSKISRITADPKEKVDASDWSPSEPQNTETQTGMRPITKRKYKRGGKIAGEKSMHRLDRTPRKSGGRTGKANGGDIDSSVVNSDTVTKSKAAPSKSQGKEPDASDLYDKDDAARMERGYKSGGRPKKMDGGAMGAPVAGFQDPRVTATQAFAPAAARSGVNPNRMQFGQNRPGMMASAAGLKTGGRAAIKDDHLDKIKGDKTPRSKDFENPNMVSRDSLTKRSNKFGPSERAERKSGGRAKGKTNINIIIGGGHGHDQATPDQNGQGPVSPPPAPPMRPPMPMGGPPPAMPVGGGAPPMPPMGGPNIPPQSMMGRKAGGRIPHLDSGSGGGEGRLEKIEIQKKAR